MELSDVKAWYHSKTVWVNALMLLAALASAAERLERICAAKRGGNSHSGFRRAAARASVSSAKARAVSPT